MLHRTALPVLAAMAAALIGLTAAAQPTNPLGLDAAGAEDLAATLLLEAAPGYLPTDIALHLVRADAATAVAVAVAPDSVEAQSLRAEVLATRGEFAPAADCCRRALELGGWTNLPLGETWLRCLLAAQHTAEERQEALDAVIADAGLPPALRAKALVNLAAVQEGRGRFDLAAGHYRAALELDPLEPTAARAVVRLAEEPDLAARAHSAAVLLRGNPRAVNVAWELALICRDVGQFDAAVRLYDYAAAATEAAGGHVGHAFRRDLLDALLDAGDDARAAAMAPRSDAGLLDTAMAAMVVEAQRRLGRENLAARTVEQMRQELAPEEAFAQTHGETAEKLAWFNHYYRRNAALARNWADIALSASPNDPQTRRTWAMVNIAQPARAQQAEAILRELAPTDLLALATLVERLGPADPDVAAALARLNDYPRRGLPWRHLVRTLAARGQARPAPHPAAAAIGAEVEGFLASPAEAMGRDPGAFLRLELAAASSEIRPGEPIEVVATLRNISKFDVPMGDWGLADSEIGLDLTLNIAREELQAHSQAAAKLPVGRRLAAGQAVSTTVRLDAGKAAEILGRRPLSRVDLEVRALLDPVTEMTDGVEARRSALPAVAAATLSLTRLPLVAEETPAAYDQALRELVAALRGLDATAALRAAGSCVALLELAQRAEKGDTLPAGKLAGSLRHPELMAMLKFCLREASPAVRLKTLWLLEDLRDNELALSLAAPNLGDASPQIRLAALRLIAPSPQGRSLGLLKSFAENDDDPVVRQFASQLDALLNPPAKQE